MENGLQVEPKLKLNFVTDDVKTTEYYDILIFGSSHKVMFWRIVSLGMRGNSKQNDINQLTVARLSCQRTEVGDDNFFYKE